jgi:outer membrane protein OmpA-like peptidoglycan-associated protein/tetratricopeptide (TPR) repeat protein
MNVNDCYLKVMIIRFFLLILLIFHSLINYSQNNNADYQKADNYYNNHEFEKAIKYYNKVLELYPENYDVNLKIARSYLKLEQFQNANIHYQKIISQTGNIDPAIYLEYGELQIKSGQPEVARNYFMKYNNLMENNDIQSFQYQNIIESNDKYYTDSSFYSISPVEFNSPANEQNPIIFNDKMFYETDQLFYNQEKVYNSIYYLNTEESELSRPSIIEGKAATKYHGKGFAIVSLTNELIINELKISKHDSVYKLFSFDFDRNLKLETDEKAILINSFENNVYFPSITNDGNLLVFSSDKDSYNGTLDLFMAYKGENGYNQPIAIPGLVNTLNNETYPYLMNDSILFFASDGHGGLGGLDIFYINLKSPNSLPVNIGYPLNSEMDETGFCLIPDGRKGFISSNRLKAGTNDIFKFKINKIHAQGLVIDESSGKNLKDVTIDIQKVDEISSIQTLADNGNFSIICLPNESYKISVSKQGYETKVYQIPDNNFSFCGLNKVDIGVFSIKQDSVFIERTDNQITAIEPLDESSADKVVQESAETMNLQLLGTDTSAIGFRVQIAASRRKINSNELKAIYGGSKDILEFQEENWYKYYIGEYTSFYEANSIRNKCNVKGSFVVAYKKGQKMVLKDAIREKNIYPVLKDTSIYKSIDRNLMAKTVIYYPYNEYQPVEKELNKLSNLINVLKEDNSSRIEIIGFADNQVNINYNIGLAFERSKFIRDYLIECNVDPARIYLRSVRQIDINTKALVRNNPENRRVEIGVFK